MRHSSAGALRLVTMSPFCVWMRGLAPGTPLRRVQIVGDAPQRRGVFGGVHRIDIISNIVYSRCSWCSTPLEREVEYQCALQMTLAEPQPWPLIIITRARIG